MREDEQSGRSSSHGAGQLSVRGIGVDDLARLKRIEDAGDDHVMERIVRHEASFGGGRSGAVDVVDAPFEGLDPDRRVAGQFGRQPLNRRR